MVKRIRRILFIGIIAVLNSCSVLHPRSPEQREFEKILHFYSSLVRPRKTIQKVHFPEHIGSLLGKIPECFTEKRALEFVKGASDTLEELENWFGSLRRVSTEAEFNVYQDQYRIYDGSVGIPIFCNWNFTDEFQRIGEAYSAYSERDAKQRAAFQAEVDSAIRIPSTLADLVDSKNYLSDPVKRDSRDFDSYMIGIIRENLKTIHESPHLTERQKSVVRKIKVLVDEDSLSYLRVRANIENGEIIFSKRFLRASFILAVNYSFSSNEIAIDDYLIYRRGGRYPNASIFADDEKLSDQDYRLINFFFRSVMKTNLGFIVAHEAAHIYLPERNNELRCDCYALATIGNRQYLVGERFRLFDSLLIAAVVNDQGHYWGIENTDSLARRLSALDQLRQRSLSVSECDEL